MHFRVVRCVTGDKHFKTGELYASIGTNNGIGVQFENDEGDCETAIMITGGVGKGFLNNPDGTGKPSFVEAENFSYKGRPYFIEKKSKKFNILFQPTLYNDLKHKAEQKGKTINELITEILCDALYGI